jgi:hypothetical protein
MVSVGAPVPNRSSPLLTPPGLTLSPATQETGCETHKDNCHAKEEKERGGDGDGRSHVHSRGVQAQQAVPVPPALMSSCTRGPQGSSIRREHESHSHTYIHSYKYSYRYIRAPLCSLPPACCERCPNLSEDAWLGWARIHWSPHVSQALPGWMSLRTRGSRVYAHVCTPMCVCGLGSGQCRHEAFGHMSAVSSANGQHVPNSGKMAASSASSITMPMPSGSRREENDVRSAGREARGRPARHTAALVKHKHKNTAARTLTGHRARTQLGHQRLQGLQGHEPRAAHIILPQDSGQVDGDGRDCAGWNTAATSTT